MLSVNNILAPKDGSPNYHTYSGHGIRMLLSDSSGDSERKSELTRRWQGFTDYDEMLMAYRNGYIGLHAK